MNSYNIHHKPVQRVVQVGKVGISFPRRLRQTDTLFQSSIVLVISTVLTLLRLQAVVWMGLWTRHTRFGRSWVEWSLFWTISQVHIHGLPGLVIRLVGSEIGMDEVVSAGRGNESNVHTSVSSFVISLDWWADRLEDASSLNWLVVLVGVACWWYQYTLLSCVIEHLIHCTVIPAIQKAFIINVPSRTVLAFPKVEIEIHTAWACGIQILTYLCHSVVSLTRPTVLTQSTYIIIELSWGTRNSLLLTQ